MKNSMQANQILSEGIQILKARATKRDTNAERSMKVIVDTFNAAFNKNMSEAEGWAFMLILKLIRSRTGKFDPDDYIDGANYFALYGEAKSNEDYKQKQCTTTNDSMDCE